VDQFLRNHWFRAVAVLICLTHSLSAQTQINPVEARENVGRTTTVCGDVRSTRYALSLKGTPTYITLDSVETDFTIVIPGRDRAKFGQPDFTYNGKSVCITGKIEERDGRIHMKATDPKQIRIVR